MPYIKGIKFDGSRYHVSFWSKPQGKRIYLGFFHSKSIAESERRKAIKTENGYLKL